MTRLRFFLLGCISAVSLSAFGYAIIDPGVGVVSAGGYPSFGADTFVQPLANVTSGPFGAGLYAIACSNTVFADQGASNVTATTSERRIPSNFVYPLKVTGNGDTYLALIGTNGGAACSISADSY